MEFIISQKAWDTMQQYAGIAHSKDGNEISGMLIVRKTKHPVTDDDVFELSEPSILQQENTGTSTELDADSLRKYYIETVKKYGTDIRYCWWHSHHTMEAFWSGTDEKEIKAWKNKSWSSALVINLRGEYLLRVSVWSPIESHEDIPLEIIRDIPEPSKKMLKEYEELCSKKVYIAPVVTNGYGHVNNTLKQEYTGNWQQKTLFNTPGIKDNPLEDTTKLEWKKSDNPEMYAELLTAVDDEIERMHSLVLKGEKKFTAYKNEVKALNAHLKKRNAKFSIKSIPKGKVDDLMFNTSRDYIKFDDAETESLYEQVDGMISHYGGYNYGWN